MDDIHHGVNLVVRGQDLLSSTGRQIALARALGRRSLPLFYHHPLIADEKGVKLSKRTLAEGVTKRREAGEYPDVIIGEALFFLKKIPSNQPTKLKDALEHLMPNLF